MRAPYEVNLRGLVGCCEIQGAEHVRACRNGPRCLIPGCLYRGFKGDITATNLFPADKRKTTFKADLAQWLISYLVVFLPGSFLVSWLALKLDGNIIDPLSLNTHIPMFGMMGMIFLRDHIPGLRGPGPWRFAIFMIAAVTVMFALSIGTYLLLG